MLRWGVYISNTFGGDGESGQNPSEQAKVPLSPRGKQEQTTRRQVQFGKNHPISLLDYEYIYFR
jgi:hypothetical protein